LVLHAAYAFVPLGILLVAGAIMFPERMPVSAGVHAWTVGAIETMTLAIMTRATLGHRSLMANWLTQAVYALVLAAAAVRIAAAFWPEWMVGLRHSAACLWTAAFWGFAIGCGPSSGVRGCNRATDRVAEVGRRDVPADVIMMGSPGRQTRR
jgi:uncharacterized protein involved in response to NO